MSKTLAHRISHRSAIEKALKERRDVQDRLVQRWRTLAATAAVLLVGVVAAALFWRSGQTPGAASRSDTGAAGRALAQSGAVAPISDSLPPGPSRATAPPRAPTSGGIDPLSVQRDAGPAATRGDSARARVATSPRTATAPAPARPRSPAAANRPTRAASDSVRPAASVAQTTSGTGDSSRAAVATDTTRRSGDVAQAPPAGAPAAQPQGTSTGAAAPATSPPPVSANTAAATEAESPRAAIGEVIAAYATAIGSRDVAAIRRAYPGMTTTQEEGWQSFFEAVRSIRARLEIATLEVSGATAVAQLTGTYEFVNRFGRTEQQSVIARATLRRDAGRWLLQTIR